MRIAYLTQPYPPMISGASIAAGQLAEEMAKRGHNVLVIAASDRDYAYTQISENLTVVRLKSANNPLRVGQRVMLAPRRQTLDALRNFQPDMIHVHEPLQMGVIGLEYAKRSRIPVTLTAHQLPGFVACYLPDKFFIREIVEKVLWLYSGWLLKRFSSIIAPTKTVSKIVKNKTGVKPKIIHYGIDLETFHPRTNAEETNTARIRYGLPFNAPIILYAGRLDMDKSVQRAILAAAEVVRHSDAHLLIVGDGNRKKHLMELCKNLGIESRTRFTGFISDKEELARIYRMSNVFITASEIETQGIVILEAAACGLPIVAVRATCIPEIVQHEMNGLLAAPGDIAAMSRALNRILNNSAAAQAMKIKSRSIAEKYSFETSFSKHEKFYRQMVRQKIRQGYASGKTVKVPFGV